MKNNTSHRASGTKTSIVGITLLLLAGALGAAIEPPGLEDQNELNVAERKVIEVLIDTYGATDWSRVIAHLEAYPDDSENANVMIIPLSLGNAHLNRYETSGSASDFERALEYFEFVADSYELWGKRSSTATVVHYLAASVNRTRGDCDDFTPLPRVPRRPIEVLWRKTQQILKLEAEFRLTVAAPSSSCIDADARAENSAEEATLFAAAANFLTDDPASSGWDEKARRSASRAITRVPDPADASGAKACPADEELTPSTHGGRRNPYSTGSTLFLLTQGALTYHLTDNAIPVEFTDSLREFYTRYTSYLSGDLSWIVSSEPEDDGALFPFVFDSEFETEAVKQKEFQGYLWQPTRPVPVMIWGGDLRKSILNSRVVLYYLMSSYLWRAPSRPCSELRSRGTADRSR